MTTIMLGDMPVPVPVGGFDRDVRLMDAGVTFAGFFVRCEKSWLRWYEPNLRHTMSVDHWYEQGGTPENQGSNV